MDTLAKHIERHLKEREFCVVFEDEVERCWPRGNWDAQNERAKSRLLPNLAGGAPLFSMSALGSEHYSGIGVKGGTVPSSRAISAEPAGSLGCVSVDQPMERGSFKLRRSGRQSQTQCF